MYLPISLRMNLKSLQKFKLFSEKSKYQNVTGPISGSIAVTFIRFSESQYFFDYF